MHDMSPIYVELLDLVPASTYSYSLAISKYHYLLPSAILYHTRCPYAPNRYVFARGICWGMVDAIVIGTGVGTCPNEKVVCVPGSVDFGIGLSDLNSNPL